MVILGIDPGSNRIGYGVIESKSGLALIDYGLIGTDRKKPEEQILENVQKVSELIKKYRPEVVAIEKLYFSKNVKTGIAVAQMRGALLLEVARHGFTARELSPSEIKLAVTGYGLADKKSVAKMVKLLLNAKQADFRQDDATDALAIAIAASNNTH